MSMTKEKKPPKPKSVAKVTLVVHDDGKVTGDFYIWEENEVGKRKLWTVSGEDFMKYVHRAQPNNIGVLASSMNLQIVRAGLPESLQGKWLRRKADGSVELSPGHFLETDKPPGGEQGKRIAAAQEVKAAKEIGLNEGDTKAAVPDAQPSVTDMSLPQPKPPGAAPTPVGGVPGKK